MDFNPVILSIPIYIALIAIEWIYDLVKKKGIYRLADAYANISSGIFEQITGIFAKVFTIGVYVFFYDNFKVTEIPTTLPTSQRVWCVPFAREGVRAPTCAPRLINILMRRSHIAGVVNFARI